MIHHLISHQFINRSNHQPEDVPMPALIVRPMSLPSTALAALAEHAQDAQGALAANTIRALRSDSERFASWCAQAGVASLPADVQTVVSYCDACAADRAPATVRRYVASIAHMHRAAGMADPTKSERVKLALRRLDRAKGTRQRQATGISRQMAEQMVAAAGSDLIDLRDRALVLVMRDLLARRSEVVALEVEDVTAGQDGTATVLIRRSKTDAAGRGQVRLLGPGAAGAVRDYLLAAGITTGALLRSVSRAGVIGGRLPAGDVSRILRKRAKAAGIDAAGISGHSARVGMAQDLVAHGCDLAAIMQAGRWASPAMPARYSEQLQARRGAVAAFYGLR
jgi:site-specific recombinase XerD